MNSHHTRWMCIGSVRGWCGHRHETQAAAERCLRRDQAGCQQQGGYSDRALYAVERGERLEIGGVVYRG